MSKNLTYKSYDNIYLSVKRIDKQISKIELKLEKNSDQPKLKEELVSLNDKKQSFLNELEICKELRIKHLEKLNNADQDKISMYENTYQELSLKREEWQEKANLKLSPDGKLKTLKKINHAGRVGGQKTVRKMILTANKMNKLANKVRTREEHIKRLNEGTYEPIGMINNFLKFWKAIPYNKQQQIFGYLFVLPWVVGFIVFFLLPISTTLFWSLNEVKPDKGVLVITWVGFNNFKALFTSYVDVYGDTFGSVLADSLFSLTLNLIVVVIFSLIIAVLLNTKFRGNAFVKAIFFIPVIFNATAIAFAQDGLGGRINSSMSGNFTIANDFNALLASMSLPDGFTAFLVTAVNQIFTIVNMSGVQILIFLAAIQSVPNNLYEAAKMEGATKYEIFWKITFPMVSPIFLTAAIYTIIDGFARSPILNFYETSRNVSQYGIASAVAVIYFIFSVLFIGIVYYIMKAGLFYHDEK